jgi:hypothetical protein
LTKIFTVLGASPARRNVCRRLVPSLRNQWRRAR